MLRLRRVLAPKKPPPTPEPEVGIAAAPILVPFRYLRRGARFRTGVGPSSSWLMKSSESEGIPIDSVNEQDEQHVSPDSLVVAWSEMGLSPAGQHYLRALRTVGTREEPSQMPPPRPSAVELLWDWSRSELPSMPDRDAPERIVTEFGFVRIGHMFYDRNPEERGAMRYRRDVRRRGILSISGRPDFAVEFAIDAQVYVDHISALDAGGIREYQNRTPRQRPIR